MSYAVVTAVYLPQGHGEGVGDARQVGRPHFGRLVVLGSIHADVSNEVFTRKLSPGSTRAPSDSIVSYFFFFSFFRSLKEERKRKTPKEGFFLSSSSSSSLFPLPGFRSSQNVCTISVNFSRRQKIAKKQRRGCKGSSEFQGIF